MRLIRPHAIQLLSKSQSAGWDPRPRAWDGPTPCPWGNVSDSYTTDPTMEELENFTYIGMQWVRGRNCFVGAASCVTYLFLRVCFDAFAAGDQVADHPTASEAGVVMLSAWNEHDEGHWIEPALDKYGGAEKLEAVKRGIDRGRTYSTANRKRSKLPLHAKGRVPV